MIPCIHASFLLETNR
ncbi:hypothetical protein [Bacillus cereus]